MLKPRLYGFIQTRCTVSNSSVLGTRYGNVGDIIAVDSSHVSEVNGHQNSILSNSGHLNGSGMKDGMIWSCISHMRKRGALVGSSDCAISGAKGRWDNSPGAFRLIQQRRTLLHGNTV
jgi:hypothetical protein